LGEAGKHDNNKKAGAKSEREIQLDEAEKYIVDVIVGQNSPVETGLSIKESGSPQIIVSNFAHNEDLSLDFLLDEEAQDRPSTSQVLDSVPHATLSSRPQKRRRSSVADEPEVDNGASRKRELQFEVLEIQVYKHKLECLKLERELQIETSKFTENLIPCQTYEIIEDNSP